ncbi:MAG TPA: hypothetical protein VGI79_15290 [Caulobacteraceae bacterium]|jgi:hypothetical protein
MAMDPKTSAALVAAMAKDFNIGNSTVSGLRSDTTLFDEDRFPMESLFTEQSARRRIGICEFAGEPISRAARRGVSSLVA